MRRFATWGGTLSRGRLALFLALTATLLGVPVWVALAAVAHGDIVSTGPLTSIFIGNELSHQVAHAGDADYEFYPPSRAPGSAGTLLAVNNVLFAPDFANHDGFPATTGLGAYTPFTPVSQSAVQGTGTNPDPFRVTTLADAGATGLRITQTDSYVVGQSAYRTDIQVANTGGSAQNVILYRAGDCYLGGDDQGYGVVDATTHAVACTKTANNTPPDRIVQFLPISGGNNYYEADFFDVWDWISSKQPFPNTCACDEKLDNGMGISWALTIPAGGQATRSHLTAFSRVGNLPLTITKQADQTTSVAGGTNGYTITVANPNASTVTLNSITDTLPPGFSYLAGSSSGVTGANPSIVGQTLTWTGPFPVAAGGSVTLHFGVRVADLAGTYFNNATGEAGEFAVGSTGDTSPITVVGGPTGTPTTTVSITATSSTTTATATLTPTGSVSATASSTSSRTLTPTQTLTPTSTPTATATPTSTNTPTPTATPLGSIGGRIFANGNQLVDALPGALVEVCRVGGDCKNTISDAVGLYRVDDLPSGQYLIRAFGPPDTAVLDQRIGPINLPGGASLPTQNLILMEPIALPHDMSLTFSRIGNFGIPVIEWDVYNTVAKHHQCAGAAVDFAVRAWDPFFQEYRIVYAAAMTEVPEETAGLSTYVGTFPPLRPIHGQATISVRVICPGGATHGQAVDVWIDPSGYVRTVDGTPLQGATVTLFRSDGPNGPFTQVPNGSAIMSPSNRKNPDATDETGHFGWDVIAGYYKVRAAHLGCVAPTNPTQAFVETAVLQIPPPVTDLDLRLSCGGGGGTATVTRSPTPTSLTPTPPAASGHGLALQSGAPVPASGGLAAQAPADRLLNWTPGTQTKTLILRWSPEHGFAFLPSPASPLPPGEGGHRDGELVTDPTYCYILLGYVGDLPNIEARSLSDLLCIYPGTASGNAPRQFTIRLNETNTALLTWVTPGGQDHYTLNVFQFPPSTCCFPTVAGNQTSFVLDTGGVPTCFGLFAWSGQNLIGNTDVLCAVPGLAYFATSGSDTGGRAALERLRSQLEEAPLRAR